MESVLSSVGEAYRCLGDNWRLVALSSCFGATVATLVTLVIYGRRRVISKHTTMRLYHHKPLRSSRCAWIVYELKAEKDIEFVDFNPYYSLQNDKEAYKKYKSEVHPHGTIPALQLSDGRVIKESSAICFLLAQHYNRLLPKYDWISYYDWGQYAAVTVDPILRTLHAELYGKSPDRVRVSRAVYDFRKFASSLQQHLEGRTFICGNEFTAADVIVGFSLMWASTFKGGVLLSDYPAVHDYLQRLKKRKAFPRGMGSSNEWLEASESPLFDYDTLLALKYASD